MFFMRSKLLFERSSVYACEEHSLSRVLTSNSADHLQAVWSFLVFLKG